MLASNLNDSIRSLHLQGVEPAAIAENFGLTEETVIAVLASRKASRSDSVLKSLEELGDRAVSTISEIMEDPDVHPVVRLKAATYVADIASGIKTPVKHVMPDNPAGLTDQLKQFMDTYIESLERAKAVPSNGVILDA